MGKLNYDFVLEVVYKSTKSKKSDRQNFKLIFDFFVFMIRREIIENEELLIRNFGRFYLKRFVKKTKVKFRPATFLRDVINGIDQGKNENKKNQIFISLKTKNISNKCKEIAKCFSMRNNEIVCLFNIFCEAILKEVLEGKRVSIRHLGHFEIYERSNFYPNFAKDVEIKRKNTINFYPMTNFLKEISGKYDHYIVTPRLQKILSFYNISTQINN